MDMSEVQVCGNLGVPQVDGELPQVDKGDFGVLVHGSEEVGDPLHTNLGNFMGQGVSSNDQFQEKLMEIDAELAKFVPSSFLSNEQNMFLERVDPNQVQETEEESEALRSIT